MRSSLLIRAVTGLMDTTPRQVLRKFISGRKGSGDVDFNLSGFLLNSLASPTSRTVESEFIRDDGTRLPIFADYRYSIKGAWQNIPAFHALATLNAADRLDERGRKFMAAAKGTRTLTIPLEELNAYAAAELDKHRPLFIPATLSENAYAILYTELNQRQIVVDAEARFYANRLNELSRIDRFKGSSKRRAIEIGAGSGVASIALAKLGFSVVAIDNGYNGLTQDSQSAAQVLAEKNNVTIDFVNADAATDVPFDDNTFDLSISNSVLEHIDPLDGVFREISRLLTPDGVAIHRYHPYFGPTGGHSYGLMDTPWGHTRLSAQEVDRYLTEYRGFESVLARPWINTSLSRRWPIARVQSALAEAGLELISWIETPASKRHLEGLSESVIREIQLRNSEISLSDIVTNTVEFVCRKSR